MQEKDGGFTLQLYQLLAVPKIGHSCARRVDTVGCLQERRKCGRRCIQKIGKEKAKGGSETSLNTIGN